MVEQSPTIMASEEKATTQGSRPFVAPNLLEFSKRDRFIIIDLVWVFLILELLSLGMI